MPNCQPQGFAIQAQVEDRHGPSRAQTLLSLRSPTTPFPARRSIRPPRAQHHSLALPWSANLTSNRPRPGPFSNGYPPSLITVTQIDCYSSAALARDRPRNLLPAARRSSLPQRRRRDTRHHRPGGPCCQRQEHRRHPTHGAASYGWSAHRNAEPHRPSDIDRSISAPHSPGGHVSFRPQLVLLNAHSSLLADTRHPDHLGDPFPVKIQPFQGSSCTRPGTSTVPRGQYASSQEIQPSRRHSVLQRLLQPRVDVEPRRLLLRGAFQQGQALRTLPHARLRARQRARAGLQADALPRTAHSPPSKRRSLMPPRIRLLQRSFRRSLHRMVSLVG